MIIANPIYDVVFKKMMENERVAKFFIGTLLDTPIEAIEVKPQEFTFLKDLNPEDPEVRKFVEEKLRERISINVYRLDYIATIRTETGEYKKILIEIQKARNPIDLMRFRNYLAEQYKKDDKIDGKKVVLPITTIYVLGFDLYGIDSPCIRVERNYRDLINGTIIEKKSEFIESLTHDSFVVQVKRITGRYQTTLDKLLSLFEQSHFIDDREITKDFMHQIDNEEVKLTADILHLAGTHPEERKKLEVEQEGWRTLDALSGGALTRSENLLKHLDAQKIAMETQQKEIETQQRMMQNQQKAMEEQEKAINDKDKMIEELTKRLNQR